MMLQLEIETLLESEELACHEVAQRLEINPFLARQVLENLVREGSAQFREVSGVRVYSSNPGGGYDPGGSAA